MRPLIILLAIASMAALALRYTGDWLELNEPLRRSRAIVVLGGGAPVRAIEAAELYRAGWAPEVWLTEGVPGAGTEPEPEYQRSWLVLLKLGVPLQAITVLPGYVGNTRAELAAVLRYLSPDPVIIVTSKSHTRRVRVIWDALARGSRTAIVRYATDDPYHPERWWRTTADAVVTGREVFAILNAWARYPISRSGQ